MRKACISVDIKSKNCGTQSNRKKWHSLTEINGTTPKTLAQIETE
jgi:hypothetical protein